MHVDNEISEGVTQRDLRRGERGHLWRSRWAAVGAAVAVVSGLGGAAIGIAGAAPTPEQARLQTSFVPTAPTRILDTRPAPENVGTFVGPLAAGATQTIQVTGLAGVPAGAKSVVMNMTVTGTTGSSYLTVWPSDQPRPTASNLNWVANDVRPNLVTVALSADGKVSIYNFAGNTHVIADVAGYYVPTGLKTVNMDIYGLNVRNGATKDTGFGANAGLNLPDAANPTVDAALTIPNDFTPGGNLTVNLQYHLNQTGCAVTLAPNFVSVGRVGAVHILGAGASTGMTSVGDDVRTVPTVANQIGSAQFTLASPSASTTLQPGDSYKFSFFRSASGDTCTADVKIDAATVSYS